MNRTLLKKIPKTDLHLHLDGSVTPRLIIELAAEQKIDLVTAAKTMGIALKRGTVDELENGIFKNSYDSLNEYLIPFELINVVLRSPQSLAKAVYHVAYDNFKEGVRYVECRFAPQKHWRAGFDWIDIVRAVDTGFKKAALEFNQQDDVKAGQRPPFNYGLILCAMRMINEHMGDYYKTLYDLHVGSDLQNLSAMASLEVAKLAISCRDQGLPVVAFDLAGREDGFPASVHREAFLYCYDKGLGTTCHAGEAYGPESIKSAIKDCFVRRIGHGTQLFKAASIFHTKNGHPLSEMERQNYVNDLVQWIAENRIALEVCLKSNSQTLPEYRDLTTHPFPLFLKNKLRIALCTDNRAISRVSVTDEYERAIALFKLDQKDPRNLVIGAFKACFYPGSYLAKRAFISQVIKDFDEVLEGENHSPAQTQKSCVAG